MFRIDRTNPTPFHQQISSWMRQQITSGLWPEHYRLVSENDLAEELGVNRGTLRKAMAELIAEGLLITVHGRGTFVASLRLEQPLAEGLVASSEDLIAKGIPFETRMISQAIIVPDQRLQSLLLLSATAQVFSLKRVRYLGQTPCILISDYLVYDRCRGIESADFGRNGLFKVLEEQFKLNLAWGRRTFEAQSASEDVSKHLGVTPCDPVMYMNQIAYLDDESPVELSDVWFRGDRFRLSSIAKRASGTVSISHSQEYMLDESSLGA